ncbi:MAG: hypothetical protein FD167_38 [bacterium]|nr:MAG: hypothetical protein FD167_38 [bacterium]
MSNNIANKENSNVEYDQINFESIEASNVIDMPSDVQNNTNEILAEMCFLEAEDLSSRRDRIGAISSYQQACKYAPTKVNYFLKLIDLLLEDNATIKKAEQVLNNALALFPNNLELHTRLNKLKNKTVKPNNPVSKELNISLDQPEINTQKVFQDDVKTITAAMGINSNKEAKDIAQNTAAILKEIDELETKSSTSNPLSTKKTAKESPFNTVKLQVLKPEEYTKTAKNFFPNNTENILKEIDELETKSSTSALKIGASKLTDTLVETGRTTNLDKSKNPDKQKFSKTKFLSSQEIKQPKHISKATWLVLGLFFLIVISGLGYQLFSKPVIILLGPAKENIADIKDIKFEWTCDKNATQFVLEVYEEESFIIKQFTKEPSYTPTPEQLARFNPEHTYKWRVLLPAGFNGDYNFATAMKTFSVSKTFEVTSSPNLPLQNQQQLEPQNQLAIPSEPIQEQKRPNPRNNPVQKSNPEGDI